MQSISKELYSEFPRSIWGIKWEMIEFCDRNLDQFWQSISIISH